MTEDQAERAIFNLERIEATGMARNQAVHEYLTYGMPLTVDSTRGRETRTVRFFDFDHPEGGLNEFVVTTQFRVRRGNERPSTGSGRAGEIVEDDERMVIPDLVLFVNGIPLVVMEAKSPSLMDVWKSQAVRQLRRYQEAGPEWRGSGAPELFHYNLMCVAHCGAAAVYAAQGTSEDAYFEWKSVLPYTEDEVRRGFGVEPQGQAQLIVGLLSPSSLLDVLRDYVIYEPEQRTPDEEAATLPAVPRRAVGREAHPVGRQTGRARRRSVAHTGVRQVADHAVAGDQGETRAAVSQCDHCHRDRQDAARQADSRYIRAVRLPRAGAGSEQQGSSSSPHDGPWAAR